jgi:long-chain acyl-CoA synthetase
MSFLDDIFQRFERRADQPVLQEAREGQVVSATGRDLLASIAAARVFLKRAGLKKGDRCALLAPNSLRWTAADLAIMAEGGIVVPLYARQAADELAGVMQDCSPSLLLSADAALRDGVRSVWPDAPPAHLFDEVFAAGGGEAARPSAPLALADGDPVTIIYTSGTSGEPKGVVLNTGNVTYMLARTNGRLDALMGRREEPDRVFHYLPCCFAGSWILLLTCLTRHSVLTLSTDLTRLAEEMRLAAPHYFLNVPVLLERVRAGMEEQINKRGAMVSKLYGMGRAAWLRREGGAPRRFDGLRLGVARALVFRAIRKGLGKDLKALICGSAPLAKETQLFFIMLGVPVLQVYGLTETTAICTMDHPHRVTPGRVGPAIEGIEMKLGEADEILVRGPNIFPSYWNRPEQTAQSFLAGWFRTGDQGEVDETGNWSIIGRVKNLIVLGSGHNVAPEPIEEHLQRALPGAAQVMLVGNGRSFLAALITGDVAHEEAAAAIEEMNRALPHYKRLRAFHLLTETFTIENGLLTANGKLKRDLIAARFAAQIEDLYRRQGGGEEGRRVSGSAS